MDVDPDMGSGSMRLIIGSVSGLKVVLLLIQCLYGVAS